MSQPEARTLAAKNESTEPWELTLRPYPEQQTDNITEERMKTAMHY